MANTPATPPDKGVSLWSLPLQLGIGGGMVSLPAGLIVLFLESGATHTGLPEIVWPFWTMLLGRPILAMAAGLLQFPVYGFLLSMGCKAGRSWPWVALTAIAAVHAVGVVTAFKTHRW